MSSYFYMAAAMWLTREGLRLTGWLPELSPWLARGVVVFGIVAIVLGFIPTVQQAMGALAKIRVGK